MRKISARAMIALVGLVFTIAVCAQDKSDGLSRRDRSFIQQAMNGGMVEIELSRIALQNATASDVKAYAQRLVADHEKAGEELKMISSKLGAAPPKPMDIKQQGDMKRFAKLSGAKLERAYAERMVKDHKGTIALFQKEAKSGKAEELKAYAEKTLPTLKEHLEMALALAEKRK